jgi:hypothetical protein
MSMQNLCTSNEIPIRQDPDEWARLIRKLRWIGMDDEARRLEQAVRSLPAEQRGTVVAAPSATD